jgi:hypothetical protein
MFRVAATLAVCALAGGSLPAPGLAAVAIGREPVGYCVLTSAQGTTPLTAAQLSDANLAGAVLRRDWAAINPAPGQYDWSYLDATMAQLTAAGKQAQITVFAGTSAPTWLYALGAQSITFTDPRFPGQTFTMPVPWDPVMLAQWNTFVAALGARYDGQSALTAVHMAGPTEFSAEMYIPAACVQLPTWSPATLIAAWTQVIGSFNTAFPTTPIVLDLSNPLNATDGIAPAVASVAVATLGARATFQHDSLAPTTSNNYNIQALVIQYAQQGVRVGFEMVSASTDPTHFNGTFAAAVAIGYSAGARYLNIYSPDANTVTTPYVPARLQNAANPADVDGNGIVAPLDSLIIINSLNTTGPGFLPPPVNGSSSLPYLDVNGDGYATSLDALIVLNTLNAVQ